MEREPLKCTSITHILHFQGEWPGSSTCTQVVPPRGKAWKSYNRHRSLSSKVTDEAGVGKISLALKRWLGWDDVWDGCVKIKPVWCFVYCTGRHVWMLQSQAKLWRRKLGHRLSQHLWAWHDEQNVPNWKPAEPRLRFEYAEAFTRPRKSSGEGFYYNQFYLLHLS